MSFNAVAILPRTGIGPIRFGQTRSQIRSLLGDPTTTDTVGVPGSETWEYEQLNLDVSFDDDANWRVTGLSAQHPRFTLRGVSLLGLPFHTVVQLVPQLKLGAYERDDQSPFGPTLTFPSFEVTICFRDGIADFISWYVLINDRDEYVWPDLSVAA